jgi:putative ABC transport system substrate-binding protein
MKSGRAALLMLLAVGVLLVPLVAEAEQVGKIYRIGWLHPTSPSTNPQWDEAFRQGLRDLGYVEGKNMVIEYRSAEGRYERLPELATDLVRLNVDLIVATASPATKAAIQATSAVPIVFVNVADPLATGLVHSLGRPGGYVTGFTTDPTEMTGKQLELLTQIIPKLSRVAAFENTSNPYHRVRAKEAEGAARALGVQLKIVEVRRPSDFGAAFASLTRGRADALLVFSDAMFAQHRAEIIDLAAKRGLPTVFAGREAAEGGGLAAYGPDRRYVHRRAAAYVDKILKGAKPGDLPVEQPTKFELVVNLKTAKALGLTIPPSLLLRADQVIE